MWQKRFIEVTNPQKKREGLRVGTSLESRLQLYYRHSKTTINGYHPPRGHQDGQQPPHPHPQSQATPNITLSRTINFRPSRISTVHDT